MRDDATPYETSAESRDDQLVLRRTFDAPRERVWRAFTDPDELAQWYGADLMTVEIRTFEAEPGGEFSIGMRDDEGDYDIEGEVLEAIENERLVHTWYVGRVTIELAAVEAGTEVVLTHEGLPGREVTEQHAVGWKAAIEALAATLATDENRASTTRTATDETEHPMTEDTTFDPSEYDTTITRTLDAPREAVWAAWTDPQQVAEWWGPEGFTVPHSEVDARPNGEFSIDMEAPDGTIYPDEGVFHEVVEPERLVFTSRAFEDENGTHQLEVRNTVTFETDGTRTRLTLEAEVRAATPDVADALGGMEIGWRGSFEKLEDYVDQSTGAAV